MNLLHKWHNLAIQNFKWLNMALIVCVAISLFSLRTIRFDSDWLSLFSKNNASVIDYRSIPSALEGERELFANISADDKSIEKCITRLKELNHIKNVTNFIRGNNLSTWIRILLKPNLSDKEKLNTIKEIRQVINDTDKNSALTGPLAVLDDFNKNVQNDFNFTGVIALILISTLLIVVYGFNSVVIYAFIVQISAMITSLSIFHIFFDSINMLAATLPCVLVGLGVDFIIHSVTAAKNNVDSTSTTKLNEGAKIYDNVAIPLFWGCITTAVAFVSLSFTQLAGLISTGVLGAITMIVMFLFVMIFVPPATTLFTSRKPFAIQFIRLPFFNLKNNNSSSQIEDKYKSRTTKIIALLFATTAAIIATFAPHVKFEDRVDKLYNADMPSLIAQRKLTTTLAAFPVPIFIYIKSKTPKKELTALYSLTNIITPVLSTTDGNNLNKQIKNGVWIKLLTKNDPFNRKNLDKIREELKKVLSKEAREQLRITGIPVLTHQLNDKLLNGMMVAMFSLCCALFIVTIILFKNIRYTSSILLILLLAASSTIGIYAIFDIRLSAYTITLFPLFMGIGVDDCLHIVYHQQKELEPISADSSAMKAIILTTLTTLLAYGALIFAINPGFIAMGIASATGITTCFLLSVYLLPIIIKTNHGGSK